MTRTAVPYNLVPKATKLPAGHDATLDPPFDPTDALIRGVPASQWPRVDLSRGGTGPPDGPLAPPGTDPARRTTAPFVWPRVTELVSPIGDLDPDIALWRSVIVSIWPFAGAPTEGIWPKGWLGIDNTGTPWVCTVGGEPGTWAQLATAAGVVTSFDGRTGSVVFNTTDAGSIFTAAGELLVGAGAGSGELLSVGADGTVLQVDTFGLPGWDYPPLVSKAGALAVAYTVTTTPTTFLTTASLAIGTWLVIFTGTVSLNNNVTNAFTTVSVLAGTATATFAGPAEGVFQNSPGSNTDTGVIALSCIVTVTAAGTLVFEAVGTAASALIAATPATGYTAVRIA
jgi:hypothetical protein